MNGIIEELGIPKKYVQNTEKDDLFIVLTHKKWLNSIIKHNKLEEFVEDDYKDSLPLLDDVVGNAWNKLFIRVFKKSDAKVIPLPRIRKFRDDSALLFCQLKQYIYHTNCKNLWKEAHRKFNSDNESSKETIINVIDYNDVLKEIITRIYNCPIINTCEPDLSTTGLSGESHLNILPALCAIESLNHIFVLHSCYLKHNLKDCLTFSPALLDKYVSKPLFLVYQLLQILKCMHDNSLTLGDIGVGDIYLKEDMWLNILPEISSNIYIPESFNNNNKNGKIKISGSNYDKIALSGETLEQICQYWINGEISNYTYITVLNNLSGRKLGDPNCHHVFPWVTDFASRYGENWRDLRKSKYRINKGDRQLDLTYENSQSQVPHHVSDVLSSITYYVYMARRTPKAVLCKNVRTVWVPAEYPSSIQRMQEWTPDECIPEFFSDPSVFRSIHDDLDDLEVPPWCSGPEEFIELHRGALESSHVSERLHHWIDLTFGYKLSGAAAVKAKNVCLHLVDEHEGLTNSGIVQLFNYPHPPRKTSSPFFNKTPPKYTSVKPTKNRSRQEAKSDDDDDITRDNFSPLILSQFLSRSRSSLSEDQCSKSPKNSDYQRSASLGPKQINTNTSGVKQKNTNSSGIITLPRDYKPEQALEIIEKRHLFFSKTFHVEEAAKSQITKDDDSIVNNNSNNNNTSVQNAFTNFIFAEDFEEQIGNYFAYNTNKRKKIAISKSGDNKVVITNYSEIISRRRIRELQILGCLIVEIFMAKQLRALNTNIKMKFQDRLKAAITILKSCKHEIAPSILFIAEMLLITSDNFKYPAVMEFGLPSPSAHLILEPLLTFIIPFPSCFNTLYSLLSDIKKYKSVASELELIYYSECKGDSCLQYEEREKAKLLLLQNINECLIKNCTKNIDELFNIINTTQNRDCVYILLPHIKQLIEDASTSVLAAWYLFDPIARVLGPDKTSLLLLQSILKLYDSEINEAMLPYYSKIAKLYHHSFLLRLIIRLNLKCFLDNFIVPLVEAVGGFKDYNRVDFVFHTHSKKICKKNAHLKTMQMDDDSNNSAAFIKSDNDNIFAHSSNITAEPEIFEFDDDKPQQQQQQQDTSLVIEQLESDTNSSAEEALDATIPENLEQLRNLEELNININDDDDNLSPIRPLQSSSYNEFSNISCEIGSKSDKNSGSNNNNNKSRDDTKISETSADSLIWLAHRLGPVLTARYLSRNLLKMLTLCYVGGENLAMVDDDEDEVESVRSLVVGDRVASKVTECLTNIAGLYGEPFILFQYIPHMTELIALCKRKISINLEGGLISCLALLQHIFPLLSDATLMDQLQDVILKNIMHPVIRLLGSIEHTFPSGNIARNALARKYVAALYHLARRIGADMTRAHLTVPALQRFFLIFDKVHQRSKATNEESPSTPERDISNECDSSDSTHDEALKLNELSLVFTPEFAHETYSIFLHHIGLDSLEISLKNHSNIRELCQKLDNNPSISFKSRNISDNIADSAPISSSIGSNIALIGNRIDVQNINQTSDYNSAFMSAKMDSNNRHLRGNWLAYWEHEIGRSDKDIKFNFKQINLQTFIGHTSSVKCLCSLDNENSFMSGGRDKTVKLWSLRNQGDGSSTTNCQWTYTAHKKSVLSITFIESMRLVASCDSVVHIWDPFMGVNVGCLESPRYAPVNLVKYMPPPSSLLFAATTEGTIKIIDTKLCNYVQELKMSVNPLGLVRCIAISPSGVWIAVGQSSGNITVLDTRTGLVVTTWRAHEGEVLQLVALDNDTIISSSLDQNVIVWDVKDGKFKFTLRGPTEPIHCLNVYNNELISGSTANRIGVHTAIDAEASFSSTKLRADTFKGLLTSMTTLPLNKLLLLGSDTGNINLLC